MKRILVITLALVFPITVVAVLLVVSYTPGLPASGQQVLNYYLNDAVANEKPRAELQRITQAHNPSGFVTELYAESFGDGSYFMVSHDMNANLHPGDNVRPLPFPPEELWCAIVAEQPNRPKVVLVAHHEDLYKAAWVAHEVPGNPTDEAVTELLMRVGCELGR